MNWHNLALNSPAVVGFDIKSLGKTKDPARPVIKSSESPRVRELGPKFCHKL